MNEFFSTSMYFFADVLEFLRLRFEEISIKRCRPLLVLSIAAYASMALAQSTSASLTGSVDDPSKAFISGASITVINIQTGVSALTKTNKDGRYVVSGLDPGTYRIEIDKQGFKSVIEAGLVLHVQDVVEMNFHMVIGSASETVTVDGSGLQMNTTDASVSTVIDRKFVENIPLNGRSFEDLISMTPGVVTASPQTTGSGKVEGDFGVNGQRTESNSYLVDGVSANASAGSPTGGAQPGTSGSVSATTALGTTQSLLSVDALQEFRVSSSTYSAEYGRSAGGQFSFSSRSGTSTLHGGIYDYLRNDVFDSNDWFNARSGIAKTAERQNDFGGTLGGPIFIPHLYRGNNRSFFFVSYEGLRLVQPTPAITQYVPSLAVRSTAVHALQPIWNAYPIPTGPEIAISSGSLSGLSPFVKAYSLPASINSTSIRVDHSLTERVHIFSRYGGTPSQSSSRILSNLNTTQNNTYTGTLGGDLFLSKTVNSEIRVGYSLGDSIGSSVVDSFGGATPLDLGSAMGISGYSSYEYLPYISITGVGTSYLNQYHESNKLSQWNITDASTWNLNRHLLKFGVDERHLRSTLTPVAVEAEPYYSTRATMTSNASTVYVGKYASSVPLFNEFAAFLQDEWKLSQSISVSMGVRWEVDPPPTEAHGQSAYTLLGDVSNPASLTLAPRGTPLWKTTWWNFAPRLGVAWKAHGQVGWETVVRAGGGVFFDTGNQVAAAGYSALGFQSTVTLLKTSLPLSNSQLNFTTTPVAPYTGSLVYAFPPHLQLPYTLQWNGSLEQGLGRNQSMTLSYVGANGRRQLQLQNHSVTALNPLFGTVYFYSGGVTSNYNALQVKFQRAVGRGLQVLASYGWSHSLDYGSTNAAYPLTYGNSDFDVRHNFQSGLSWNLPQVRGNFIKTILLNNWSVDGRTIVRTAFPVNLTGNLLLDAVGNSYYSGVNYNLARPAYLYGKQYPGGRAFNGGANNTATPAFSLPTGTAVGNAPRNFMRGFGEDQMNLALRREFRLRDAFRLQFRAESFNSLNHPTFGYVNPTLSNAQFGQATKMLNQSLVSMSSLYQQGGPRSLQFALKLLF